MQNVLKEVETRMSGAVDALSRELASVRTGRASTALLDGIRRSEERRVGKECRL